MQPASTNTVFAHRQPETMAEMAISTPHNTKSSLKNVTASLPNRSKERIRGTLQKHRPQSHTSIWHPTRWSWGCSATFSTRRSTVLRLIAWFSSSFTSHRKCKGITHYHVQRSQEFFLLWMILFVGIEVDARQLSTCLEATKQTFALFAVIRLVRPVGR